MPPYNILVSLGLDLLQTVIDHFTKSKLPDEVIAAVQGAYDALEAHAKDVMSKEEWEALRG